MSGISMGGMGTGLDIYGMANQLATIQVQPKANQLAKQEAEIDSEIAALNELSDSLNSFYNTLNKYTDPTIFGSVHVQMQEDDESTVGISVDENAMPNTYELGVQELAARHKIELFNVSAVDEVDEDGNVITEAGAIPAELAGEYTLTIDGEAITVNIEEGDAIGDVATLINDHPDNPGMTAGVISDGETSYLTLTSDDTGKASEITVERDGGQYEPIELQAAQDAEFTIDGIKMTSDTNKVEDVIPGVTFDLKSTTEEKEPVRFEIQPDTSAMSSSVDTIVESFNDVLKLLDELGSSTIDDSGTVIRGPLANDSMVNGLRSELRSILQTPFDEPFPNLASIGVMTDRDGYLEVDSEMLDAALEEDPKAVTAMFKELADEWKDVATQYIGRPEEEVDEEGEEPSDYIPPDDDEYIPADGLISERVDNLERDLRGIEDEWATVETRYENIYQRYLNEFIAMDLAVSQIQNSMYAL